MATPAKDTIYIDIDDEITGIIDKLRASEGKVVALVLPKRATVLQSIVNMRLLKRAADDTKQHVVLITSEAGLLPLAGVAGVYVAKSLTSKPEIPSAPVADDDEETVDEVADSPADDESEITAATAGSTPVGALAGLPPKDEVETVELDDDASPDDIDGSSAAAAGKKAKPPKVKKDKSLAVPNFERFRLWLVLGGLILILLIGGLVMALQVLPKATISIKTDATNVNANLSLNLSTTAKTLDADSNTIPATLAQQQKTYTQQVATTGQQNNGDKATGKVTFSLNDCSQAQVTIPAGTGVSANGLTYITQEGATLNSVVIAGHCHNGDFPSFSTATVDVTAQSAGARYNAAAGSYTAAGVSGVSTSGTAMSGGTDNVVQVVSQTDIDNAKSKIATNDASAKQAMENQLKGQGLYSIAATFSSGSPTVTTSANVGDTADNVTVTEVVTYTMFGVHQSDLKTLVDNAVKTQIDTAKQSILNEGLSTATYNIQSSNNTGAQVSLSTTAVAGPQLDVGSIKQEVAGLKSGDIKSQLETNPDVTDVTVKLSPFWVTTVPKKSNKITVTIAKPTTTKSQSNANNP
jgi:hypothetical protein